MTNESTLLQEHLSDASLRELAGDLVFDRGMAYAMESRVNLKHTSALDAVARVRGTQSYTTHLWFEDGELQCDCTCPHAADGAFCKHMVATALAWRQGLTGTRSIAVPASEPTPRERAASRRHDELRDFLARQPAEALAERLLSWSTMSRELRGDLQFWRQQNEATDDPRALKSAIGEHLKTSGFLDWRESNAFARRAARAVDLLQGALDAGRHAACAQAGEAAIRRLFRICEQADDSDGAIGEVLRRTIAIWMAALRNAPGDVKTLGERVYELRRADPFGMIALDALQDVLSAEGLARYDACAAKAWRQLPARIPPAGKSRIDRFSVSEEQSGERAVDDHYEEVLRRHGDVDGVLAVLTRDLTRPHRIPDLVEYCHSVNRYRAALAWAEKGVKLFADDWPLKRLLAELYERDGLDDQAAALRFELFCLHPSASTYGEYVGTAARVKSIGRDAARERALEWAEKHEKPVAYGAQRGARDVSLRVQLALAENRANDALALVQAGHACNAPLLETLAARLSPDQGAARGCSLQARGAWLCGDVRGFNLQGCVACGSCCIGENGRERASRLVHRAARALSRQAQLHQGPGLPSTMMM